jgi:hypothetical protein
MEKQILNEEFRKMQKLAGLLNEEQSNSPFKNNPVKENTEIKFGTDGYGEPNSRYRFTKSGNGDVILDEYDSNSGRIKGSVYIFKEDIKRLIELLSSQSVRENQSINEVESDIIKQLQDIRNTRTPAEIKDTRTGEMVRMSVLDAGGIILAYNALLPPQQEEYLKLGVERMEELSYSIRDVMNKLSGNFYGDIKPRS